MLLLKQSTSVDVKVGPFVDSVDGVTPKTALTITQPDVQLGKNGAAFAQKNAAQTLAHEVNGWYEVTLDATDTNTLGNLVVAIYEVGALPVWDEFVVVPANVYDSLVLGTANLATDTVKWLGTAAATPTVAGVPEVDITHFNGVAGSFTSGKPDVQTVNALASNTITAASIATGAITAAKFAANAIDAAALASDAVAEIRSVVNGTGQSGTTTTIVDTARTEADTDYWKGSIILFTSGSISGQSRLITGFNAGTDTITFAPATTQAASTNTYQILPAGRVDVHNWLGAVVNALISGRVDANMQASATGSITSATFAAGAIDAAAIANAAIDAATFAANAIDATAIAANAITSAKINAGAITAATFAAGALDANALATDAVNEIRDAVWAQAMTELASVPGVTGTVLQALEWVFLLSRNKITQTSTTQLLRNDADSGTIGTATVSDDSTTFVRGEFA